ncbi:cytochrome c biogenesis protein [Desulfolithobacter sp.]
MHTSLRDRIYIILTAVVFATAIYMVFIHAPTERIMGSIQKIFYFHLACALAGFLSFLCAFVSGIFYLVRRDMKWDILGAASVEIGLVFTTLVLVTGMLWGRPVWNTWWTWDPRLTTSLILWFIYASCLILRFSVDRQDKRATFFAVMTIIGFVDVPIVFMSARLWRSIHPVVIRADSIDMAPAMIHALLVTLTAFIMLWILLLYQRSRTLSMHNRIQLLEKQLYGEKT